MAHQQTHFFQFLIETPLVHRKPHNGPLARKLKYVRNVGDVTSGGASATILCTEKIGETAVLVVRCSRVPESCSLPRVCEQSVKVLTLRLAMAFKTCESTVARVKSKNIRCRCRQCPETPVSYTATSHRTTPVLPFIAFRKSQVREQDGFERLESSRAS